MERVTDLRERSEKRIVRKRCRFGGQAPLVCFKTTEKKQNR